MEFDSPWGHVNHVRGEKKLLVVPGFKKHTNDEGVTHVSAFMCRHSDDSTAQAASVLAEAREHLLADDTNLLSAVVYRLNFEYSASITGIDCDQWAMVCAETYDHKFKVTVQCDRVEDGIAAVWKAFRDHGTPVPDE